MSEILYIGVILLIAVLILELFKHILTKTFLKFIVLIVVGVIVFLAIVNSLSAEDLINTDNEYIETGATIAGNINEQPLVVEIKDRFKESMSGLKDKILESIRNRD